MAVAEETDHDLDVILYLKERPTRETLERLVSILEDPVTDLVRRDSQFAKLGLTDDDVASAEQVVELLLEKPGLMQRPIVVRDERAIIGRPKGRVAELLAD